MYYIRHNWRILTSVTAVIVCLMLGLWLLQPQDASEPGSGAAQSADTTATLAPTASDEKTDLAPLQSNDSPGISQTDTATTVSTQTYVKGAKQTTSATQSSAQAHKNTAQHTESEAQTNLTVKLSINDSAAANVTVPQGANQCDVLTAALAQDVLSSLEMYYNPTYKTYAVHIINGQGSHDVVWWAYTVNDRSPPVGCSNVQVSGGDNINWEYTGR